MCFSKTQRFLGPENEHVILTPIIIGCLMRIPKTFRETFQLAKLVLVSTDCLKVRNGYGKNTSKIYTQCRKSFSNRRRVKFTLTWCKQKTKTLDKTTYIQASRFVFITPASFEVPQVIR